MYMYCIRQKFIPYFFATSLKCSTKSVSSSISRFTKNAYSKDILTSIKEHFYPSDLFLEIQITKRSNCLSLLNGEPSTESNS